MQPPTTIQNHPQPPTITQKAIQNHPQPSKTAHNYPQPSTTTHNYLKTTQKIKTCHKQLCYCTLDVNTKTDIDFDSDMKQ